MGVKIMNDAGTSGSICSETVPLTLAGLIAEYRTHRASGYHKLRHQVRLNCNRLLFRLEEQHGPETLSSIRASTVQIWYDGWSAGGKLSMGHAFVAQLRTLFSFGLLMIEDRECERLSVVMSKLKFAQTQSRTSFLTADHAVAIRETARNHFGWHSIALAQALQFELLLRQKDVIGEWVPETEPGESSIRLDGLKWLRGLRWSEIDDNWILRHVTSKRQKLIEVDLKSAPMVLEELQHHPYRPADGAIVVSDTTGWPWTTSEFRRKWRIVADQAGIPKDVRNQDSRAGGITEATEAGAELEHVKHAATHSDIAQTQRYSRNASAKIANVQAKRLEFRNRSTH
jgi:hypothetical protein